MSVGQKITTVDGQLIRRPYDASPAIRQRSFDSLDPKLLTDNHLVAGVRPIISYGGRDRIHYDRSSTMVGGGGGVWCGVVAGCWVVRRSTTSTSEKITKEFFYQEVVRS